MRINRTDRRSTKLTKKRVEKISTPKHDGFSVAFKRAAADGHARFFESRGMPVPEKQFGSFGGATK